MSDVIDWSKAPEGATHYALVPDVWYRSYGYFADFWNHHTSKWAPSEMWQENRYTATARPQPAQWSGEGLPPVGTVCEWFSPAYGWLGGKVVGRDGTVSVIAHNDGYTGCHPHEVRPLRTPEQIAADDREAAIKEMAEIGRMGDGGYSGFCSALYDAGYRKQ